VSTTATVAKLAMVGLLGASVPVGTDTHIPDIWLQWGLAGVVVAFVMWRDHHRERRMPAGLGWHPFFSGEADYLEAGIETAPNGPAVQDPGQFWDADYAANEITKGVFVDRLRCDAGFLWPARKAHLIYPEFGTVALAGDAAAEALTVYRPPGAGFVAVEPQTHVPGAHGHPYPQSLGLRVLAPGEHLAMTVTLSVF